MKKLRLLILVFTIILLFSVMSFAGGTGAGHQYQGELIEISTPSDLVNIKNNPSGKYILVNDIDLSDVDWTPLSFSGYLDGNGYHIFNLTVNKFGIDKRTVYDCNHVPYEGSFAGLFSVLEKAEIRNLEILGARLDIKAENENAFTGVLAGYMDDSYIYNSTVDGISYLSTSGHCFGIAGIAGYGGYSTIENCYANVILTCVDNDREYMDEQFMGGAYSLGYIDLKNVNVTIQGFDEDHGYVHDGGLVGAYYIYDWIYYEGLIENCTVNGKITFFEDNYDRRAYCEGIIGERMNWLIERNNSEFFTRNEIFDYSKKLEMHMDCDNKKIEDTVIEYDYDKFGYTIHKCSCGFSYIDTYVLNRVAASSFCFRVLDSEGKEAALDSVIEGDSLYAEIVILPENAEPKLVSAETKDSCMLTYPAELRDGKYYIPLYAEEKGSASIELLVDTKDGFISNNFDVTIYTKLGLFYRDNKVMIFAASGILLAGIFTAAVLIIKRKKD